MSPHFLISFPAPASRSRADVSGVHAARLCFSAVRKTLARIPSGNKASGKNVGRLARRERGAHAPFISEHVHSVHCLIPTACEGDFVLISLGGKVHSLALAAAIRRVGGRDERSG